jgi:hypothetical protein
MPDQPPLLPSHDDRLIYQTPRLEPERAFRSVTGVSLPIGNFADLFDEDASE